MKGKWIGFVTACALLAAWGATVQADPPPLTLWTQQIGSSDADPAHAIALDASGNIYITGYTDGDLGGPSQGGMDAFVVKYDMGGTVQWARQIGSPNHELGSGIAVDGSGNSYITGYTWGDLGGPNQGRSDTFIVKYDSGGTEQWVRQIGTVSDDDATGIALDSSGNIYIAGHTGFPHENRDIFIAKYDSSGMMQWMHETGTSTDDVALDIAVDGSGKIYITGDTFGNLGGPNQGSADAFIAASDNNRTVLWTQQIGSSAHDSGYGIAVDASGNSYITGYTQGDLCGPYQGGGDAFIAKYDSGGTVQWMRQIGTSEWDRAYGIAVDGSGNIYIVGHTNGDLGGPNQGGRDAFIVAYDSGGTVQWARQIGTSEIAVARGVAVDGSGNIYIAGFTYGDMGGPNQGGLDAFIMAIGTTPATGGDATLDGCVDGLDYVLWANNYQTGTWWVQGDFSDDGVVDGLDYILWSSNYKVACPGVPGAVPEPTVLSLLALGFLALRRRSGG